MPASAAPALAAAEQALARLAVLAESSRRCPYRAVDEHCRASFGFRNQRRRGDGRVCAATDDDLDWRAAG